MVCACIVVMSLVFNVCVNWFVYGRGDGTCLGVCVIHRWVQVCVLWV